MPIVLQWTCNVEGGDNDIYIQQVEAYAKIVAYGRCNFHTHGFLGMFLYFDTNFWECFYTLIQIFFLQSSLHHCFK